MAGDEVGKSPHGKEELRREFLRKNLRVDLFRGILIRVRDILDFYTLYHARI